MWSCLAILVFISTSNCSASVRQFIFQFDSIIELFCYGCDICISDMTRFKIEITTQHQFDETQVLLFGTYLQVV